MPSAGLNLQPHRRRAEHGALDGAFLVLQGKVQMARHMTLKVRDLAAQKQIAQHRVARKGLANVLVELLHRQRQACIH